MSVGVICLTPENLERPWILFEAGALSKTLGDKTRVCPYLFGGLQPENVRPPLGMFQATKAVKDETRKLVGTVNRVLGGPLAEEKLYTVFQRMWPELEDKLAAVPAAPGVAEPRRSERDILVEVLDLARAGATSHSWNRTTLGSLRDAIRELVNEGVVNPLLEYPSNIAPEGEAAARSWFRRLERSSQHGRRQEKKGNRS
jgi:hypothetical protein